MVITLRITLVEWENTKSHRVRELPDFLDGYLTYVQNSEPSKTFHTWAGISLLAGALQRKVKLVWGFEHLYPNLYVILVGPAGKARKGVALGIAKNLLLNIPGVSVAAESCTRESMILAMKRAISNYEDPTTGKVKIHCSLTSFSEELSVLLGQSDVKLLANLCDWYDSKSVWTYETVGRGRDSLEGLCFNLLGATAPEWIQSMLPTEAIGGGFTSRCIFIVEENKGKIVPKHQLTSEETDLEHILERDLEKISQLKGQFTFSSDGSKCYEEWYTEQEHLISIGQPAVEDPRFAAYCERRATHIRKLAMILSASKRDDLVIDHNDFHRAVEILTFAERKMGYTFGGLGKYKHSDSQEKILNYIERLKITTRSTVLAKFHRDLDANILLEIERTLEQMGVISVQYNLQTKEKIYRWIDKRAE